MALPISQGSGATIATELISGQHYGYNKITDASLGGSATVGMIVDSGANASGAAHVFLRGNVTLSDPKGFIGLTTITGNVGLTGNLPAFTSSPTIQPFVQFFPAPQSIASGGFGPLLGDQFGRAQVVPVGNVTLTDSKGFIGLVTTVAADPKGFIGLVTVGAIIGNVTLSDPKGFIGLVTATGNVGITGNVTLSDPKGYIGLVTIGGIGTVTLADPKGFIGLTTTVIGSAATIYAVVNTGAATDPKTYIGLVTVGGIGTLTLSDPKGFIGLVTATGNVGLVGNVTLSDPKGFIGLVTATGNVGIIGNVTLSGSPSVQAFGQFFPSPQSIASGGLGPVLLDQFGRQQAVIIGNLTLSDPKGFIGLVTVTGGISFAGNVTLDPGSKTGIVGNVTLSDPKGFIGLVTIGGISQITLSDPKGYIGLVTIGGLGTVTLADPKGYIGLVTITGNIGIIGNVTLSGSPSVQSFGQFFPAPQSIASGGMGPVLLDQFGRQQVTQIGNITLSDPKGFIGLVTVTGGVTFIGNVTLDPGSKTGITGNVTLTDSKGFIGLVTIGGISTLTLADPKGYIGLVTVGGIGTLTLSDPKGFIGLVTVIPTFTSGYTSLSTVVSATGVATIIVPPSGQKIFVKDIHVSSLGRSEISFWGVNGGTATINRIPWTSLSTTSGFVEFFGDSGSQWGQADDGLTVALNGAATVGVMINARFA